MKITMFALAALLAVPAVHASAAPIDQVIAGPQRSEVSKARDQYRHPKETLAFFGIKPTSTVVEVGPGGGWYTEILWPLLKDKGSYTAAIPRKAGESQKAVDAFKAKFPGAPVAALSDLPAGRADAVVTFRNVHNWVQGGFAAEMFAGFFKALKPGGVLGLEEHRLPESRHDADEATSGYMKTSTVVKLAEAAGFKLAAKSEINANPKDKADYPKGVWTLPPTYQLGDVDKAKYAAIGESDRMTLKFVKPK